MLQSDSTQTIDHIQFQKAVVIDHSIFLSVEALMLRQGQLHFFKRNHLFFSMTLLAILRRIQRPTTQGHSSNAKYETSREIIFIYFHFLRYP